MVLRFPIAFLESRSYENRQSQIECLRKQSYSTLSPESLHQSMSWSAIMSVCVDAQSHPPAVLFLPGDGHRTGLIKPVCRGFFKEVWQTSCLSRFPAPSISFFADL